MSEELETEFLEACAEVKEAGAKEVAARERKLAAAARALKLARKITRDHELDDDAATREAWRLALERAGRPACPS
jgi:hypothetical protein